MPVLPVIRISACVCAALAALVAGDATVAGTPTAPSPTQYGISLVWPFSDDANGNGRVTVRYRPSGGMWKQGMPLFRVPSGTTAGITWSNHHAGSLFDLQPATTYEVELTLTDPDGGAAVQTVSVATRALPVPMAGAPVKAVNPATFATVASGAQPGDILELAAGTYSGFSWSADGQAAKPIVIRSSVGAVIDGNIDLISRSYIQLDGLTVEGRIRFNLSRGIAVQRCTIHAHADRGGGDGINSALRSDDAFIADNTVVGTTVWAESSLGVSGINLGEGICLTGPGHVMRNNRVRAFRDGISLMELSEAVDQYSIDIIENDISECADDGIEVDTTAGNCRVMRNRLTNCFMGISSQPGLGGPLYLVRNVLYNVVFEAFKLHNGTYGDVLLHNTVVKSGDAFSVFSGATIARTWARNNLFIGGPGSIWNGYNSGTGRVMDLYDLDVATASLDYNGYGSTAAFFSGKFGPTTSFADLAQLRSLSTEAHAVQVGLSAFASAISYPAAPMTIFAAPDLRLAASSSAVNAGVAIPGINDGFAGAAPDLGAYEVGQALPAYGPRSPGSADLTPPLITGLVVGAITASGASVSWTTNEAADSQVEYGLTTGYGATSALNSTLVIGHSVTLSGLGAGTTYHCRVKSRDEAGNLATSGDTAFTTTTTVDNTPPATPPAPSVTGSGTTTPNLSGTTEAGATVRIYDGGVLIATTTANSSGVWSVTLPVLGAGSHALTVTSSDTSGNTSGASPAVTVTSPGGSAPVAVSSASGGSSCGLGGVAAAMIMLSLVCGLRLRRR